MAMNWNDRPARPWLISLLLGALAAFGGCSSGTDQGNLNSHLTAQGTSIPGWLTTQTGPSLHSRSATQDFVSNGSVGCVQCHGADLAGGISRVSCLTSVCHHNTPVTDWPDPAVHGADAKQAPGASGFAACQICHGLDFSKIFGTKGRCSDCHGVSAPHPAAPWRGGATTHINTNIANAPVCARCHFPGSANNPAGHPATPAPPGTPPGCFNNTLCHGPVAAPHALGAAWRDPAVGGSSFHGTQAKQDLTFCQGCHGALPRSFDGGAASTACSSCHTAAKAHPTDWQGVRTIGTATITHRTSTDPLNPTGQCALCHKVDGPGTGPNPAAPSCFSASFTNANGQARSCHAGGPGAPNHSIPFLGATHFQATTTTFASDCGNCHAVTGTSPVSSAPLCSVCHTVASPLTTGNCASCHADPPDGAVGSYPNVAGAHTTHITLNGAGTPVTCSTCHTGLDNGTLAHYNRANGRPGAGGRVPPGDVAFGATYDAKSGASSFDNVQLRCSNVSCHGGQATPNWQTVTIDVNLQCTLCHEAGTAQYNSYYSGKLEGGVTLHVFHVVRRGVFCTACHNTASLAAAHFNNLSTPAMEGPASATIGGGGTSIPAGNYNPAGTKSCTPVCHGRETWL